MHYLPRQPSGSSSMQSVVSYVMQQSAQGNKTQGFLRLFPRANPIQNGRQCPHSNSIVPCVLGLQCFCKLGCQCANTK